MITLERERNVVTEPTRSELGPILGLAGLVFWLIAVYDANFLKMGAYGLVSILGWPYFAGLALVVVGFTLEMQRTPLRSGRLVFLIVLLALFLYGTACAIEPVAALPDSWIHAGFTQYIVQHGHPLNGYDARFSWPGGFSLAAVLVAFVGKANALGFLRWFPLFIELAYLAPLLVIARFSGVNGRTGWLGVAIYYSTNWIYQDYFSPQALNYLFYLVVVATVLACWQPRRRPGADAPRGLWRQRLAQSMEVVTRRRLRGDDATTTWGTSAQFGALALLGFIFIASSMSHQLTPYALILVLCACLLTRRLSRPELIVLLTALAIGWLSLGASDYWVGHLSAIFGSIGAFGSTLNSNVTSRVTGASTHVLVVGIRILLTGGLYVLAGVGFLRRSTDSRALEALAGASFLLLAAQNYGGKGLLRVVLFGLPFTALLAASAILPRHNGEIRSLVPPISIPRFARLGRSALSVLIVVVLVAFAVATTIVRGGNDAFESFSKGKVASVHYAYDHVHAGQNIAVLNYNLPTGQRDVGTVSVSSLGINRSDPSSTSIANLLRVVRPTYIILSQSQEAYGEEVLGYPVGWEASIESTLLNLHCVVVAQWTTATVLKVPD